VSVCGCWLLLFDVVVDYSGWEEKQGEKEVEECLKLGVLLEAYAPRALLMRKKARCVNFECKLLCLLACSATLVPMTAEIV
jgi:hypothetical protein